MYHRQLLDLTSKKIDSEQAVWRIQSKYKIVDGPKKNCIYDGNDYEFVDIDARSDADDSSVLNRAIVHFNFKDVKFLLEAGINPNIQGVIMGVQRLYTRLIWEY